MRAQSPPPNAPGPPSRCCRLSINIGHNGAVVFGTHLVLYSNDADADRAFLAEVLGFESVDGGGGWLIFALPPAEAAVHPAAAPGAELFLMCDDLLAEMAALADRGVVCSEVKEDAVGVRHEDSAPRRRGARPLPTDASDGDPKKTERRLVPPRSTLSEVGGGTLCPTGASLPHQSYSMTTVMTRSSALAIEPQSNGGCGWILDHELRRLGRRAVHQPFGALRVSSRE